MACIIQSQLTACDYAPHATLFDLSALGTITGVNVIGSGNITIEWMEPDPSCDCIKKYIIESTGAVLGSSPCGNPQYVCDECRCEEHSLTVTPDLRNRIRVESSRSDPVIVGKGKYANVRLLVMFREVLIA